MKKRILILIFALVLVLSATGCSDFAFEESGDYIITAEDALAASGAILIDARDTEAYQEGHVEGAVCLPMSALTTDEPYSNMLADETQIAEAMGAAGITENDTVFVYDDASNMQSARIQWSLNMFGNTNVKVISGGYTALEAAGANIVTTTTEMAATEYNTGDKQRKLIVSLEYIKMLIDEPEENTVIIDTRSAEEYAQGTIPGAINIEYIWNDYADGSYKSPRDIRLTYLNKGIYPEMKIIVFCKTSVRAAQTYTALKDAGYQDVRVYDGAWLEFEATEGSTIAPSETAPVQGDAS